MVHLWCTYGVPVIVHIRRPACKSRSSLSLLPGRALPPGGRSLAPSSAVGFSVLGVGIHKAVCAIQDWRLRQISRQLIGAGGEAPGAQLRAVDQGMVGGLEQRPWLGCWGAGWHTHAMPLSTMVDGGIMWRNAQMRRLQLHAGGTKAARWHRGCFLTPSPVSSHCTSSWGRRGHSADAALPLPDFC